MFKSIFLVAAVSVSVTAHAELAVGDVAPPIKVANIVKGKPVSLAKGVHVVEFWATWCGPCRQSIPHLTEMAKKFKGKVDFTGVSVWENGDNQLGKVKEFVTSMGDKMDYNVAFDGPSKFMADNWMTAAKQNGIPAAFLVKDGKVLWIGHPMDGLDETLGKVVAGKFDIAAAKVAFAEKQKAAAEEDKKAAAQQELMKAYQAATKAKDAEAMLKALGKVADSKMFPPIAINYYRAVGFLQCDDSRGSAAALELSKNEFKSMPMQLNELAWLMVDPEHPMKNADYKIAVQLAQQAVDLTKGAEHAMLDTLATALFLSGDKAKALEVETKALELAKKDPEGKASLPDYEKRIAWIKG